jgi:hypothetical protein
MPAQTGLNIKRLGMTWHSAFGRNRTHLLFHRLCRYGYAELGEAFLQMDKG